MRGPGLAETPHMAGTEGLSMIAVLWPGQSTRAATQELALLISRMQANADQVERDILETQKKLQQVRTLSGQEGRGMEPQGQRQRVPRGSPVKRDLSTAHHSRREGFPSAPCSLL